MSALHGVPEDVMGRAGGNPSLGSPGLKQEKRPVPHVLGSAGLGVGIRFYIYFPGYKVMC